MWLKTIISSLLVGSLIFPTFAVEKIPQAFKDTSIIEKLSKPIRSDVSLTEANGKTILFTDILGEKPILVNFVYYSCPRLCHMVTTEMTESLKLLPKKYLENLRIVTISFDHRDTKESATNFKERYKSSLEKELGYSVDWQFYIGDSEQVKRLADSVGFRYYFNETSNQYSHSSALILLTPKGLVSRYLYGIEYKVNDLKLSIIEANKNKSLSSVDSVLLFCYDYDPLENTYIVQSMKLMKIAGAITVFIILFFVLFLKSKEKKDN
jgi:protein SCO1/2